jgi:hypothetical protein
MKDDAKPIYPRWRDAALIEDIADKVSRGWCLNSAGMANGLSSAAVSVWLHRYEAACGDGEADDRTEFREAVSPIARALAVWLGESGEMASSGDQGRQWMLARRLASVYGQKSEVALTTTVKPVSEDETRAMLGAMATAADQPEDC